MVVSAAYDMIGLSRAAERTNDRRAGAGPESVRTYAAEGEACDDRWVRHAWHVWWAPSLFWRDDLTWPNGATTVCIVRADAALAYVSVQGILYTSESSAAPVCSAYVPGIVKLPSVADRLAEFPLLRPPFPESDWSFATGAPAQHLGREARRIRATRRAGTLRTHESQPSGYWAGIDEYECVVDVELGSLLSLAGLVDGALVAVIAADEVRINEAISDDVLAFVPPPGTRTVQVARRSDEQRPAEVDPGAG